MHVQGFPSGVGWWGDILAKMGKNYMKMKKSAFFCVIIVGGKEGVEGGEGGGGGGGGGVQAK